MNPVPIHAESAKDDATVMAAEVVVDGADAFGFKFQEQRVDELHDVVASPSGEHGVGLR